MSDLKKENDSPVHMGQLTDEKWSDENIAEALAELEAREPCQEPFHSTLEGKAARIISSLHAALVVAEKERDQHKTFINALATEQRPSGRFGDHPTDGARAAREYLK